MSVAYVLLFLGLGLARTAQAQCPKPSVGPNMILKSPTEFPAPEGSRATFECEVGYMLVGGSVNIFCSGGRWSPLTMKCELRNCGSAGEVVNGYVDYSEGTEFGATVKAVCDDGFTLVGAQNSLYCGVQGWMGKLAECEAIVCDAPPPIANGLFNPNKDEYLVNEVITYSCEKNYFLNGSADSTCTENRIFNNAPPTCVLPPECENPVVSNGQWAGGSRPPYKHPASVIFVCNTGYKMEGTNTVSCDINSKWTPSLPNCTPIECKAPQLENGDVVNGPRPSYKYKDTVSLKCNDGYKLNGPSTLTCDGEDQWSPRLPQCTEIICRPPEVKDGKLVGVPRPSYKYSETVTFECNTGYNMTGPNLVKCGKDQQWSPSLPQCTLIPTKPTSAPPTPGNGGHVTTIVLSVLGVSLAVQWLQHNLY